MRILVVGNGGREHALAWKLARSPRVQKVYVAPGNGGTATERGVQNLPISDLNTLLAFAVREKIELTVVGPEAPLAAGLVDKFKAEGLRVFGPTQAAAQLESSKDFAKQFMKRHGIPTAAFETFTDAAAAKAYIAQQGAPIVVKADGLASGKGVVVASSIEEAQAAVDAFLVDNRFGMKDARVVVEEFLSGEEASFIVVADGRNVLALASSQDHKRLKDADEGPNTGGMGAYSPAPVVTPEVHARVMREVILPTVARMASDGIPYSGFLYAGLMIDGQGNAKVLEYNCRLGDPETQPILMRLQTDLVTIIDHALDGKLDKLEVQWDRRCALGVVMASAGYPDHPRTGDRIEGIPAHTEDCAVFHAGSQRNNDLLLTSGGRVLCVTALGDSVRMAQRRAYDTVTRIHFDGMQYRRDIGFRAIGRNSAQNKGQEPSISDA